MRFALMMLAVLGSASTFSYAQESRYYELPKGDYPHDVAAGPNGEVWYSGQSRGIAGRLNPGSGEIERIPLGRNSAPHGVIVGPDGAPWFTDGGQNALCASIPQASKSSYGHCRVRACPMPISTPPLSTSRVASGSRDRAASMAGSTRKQMT